MSPTSVLAHREYFTRPSQPRQGAPLPGENVLGGRAQ